ncbi:prolyl 4-hydroxylase subunit alpha-3-like [Biomphalaria glabrata]|uniref:Prolyl 4-hydroxylase subunit alpha-3-like n=1 Tax=Biomphalaria glabrata TaxID=6526 RepID=A0A9W2YIC8_BIOGL|nr:prolyl 4-hydroxylase subunit alpha-3-like [Biomphalaria glabrata]XP_055862440.1 prolyl 4-hydroxylase subunit alpha-3-like [Biomphalaria glabrata]
MALKLSYLPACVLRTTVTCFILALALTSSWGAPHQLRPGQFLVTSSHWIDLWSKVDLAGNLQRFIDHEEIRLRVIRKFENNSKYEKEIPLVEKRLTEFQIIHQDLVKNASDTAFIASLRNYHPITIFASVRNFVATWENRLKNQTTYGRRLKEFLQYKVKVPLPTRLDLDKIGTAITVIQAAYNLSMNDLLLGKVLGQQGEQLTRADCYDIGKTVMKAGLLDTATEWLETAINLIDLNNVNTSSLTFDLGYTLSSLAKIAFKRNDPEKSVRLLEKAVDIEPDNRELYSEYMSYRFARNVKPIPELNRDKVEPWRKTFFDTCQNTVNATWLEEQRKTLKSNVRCRLKQSASAPILFYKEEIMSTVPYISVIHDFLSDDEIKLLKNKTLDQLEEKLLPGEDPNTLWQYKGSYFRDDYSEVIERVSKRAADVSHMDALQRSTSYSLGEPLQIVDFGISGLALPHAETRRQYEVKYMGILYGARVATLQAFLSDTILGGATMFVQQNVTIVPRKGTAVLWYNFQPNGDSEPNLQPSICPLLVGDNIVLKKGFWRLGLDSRSRCGRKKNSSNLSILP